MIVVYSEAEAEHAPQYEFEGNGFTLRPHPEALGRGRRILDALTAEFDVEMRAPDPVSDRDLTDVHRPEYIRFLKEMSESNRVVAPDTFALRGSARAPRDPLAALGYYGTDPATPIGPGTWVPVQAAAAVARSGAQIILETGGACYGLCRPPGHHAGADYFGGFCYLNNAAVAAELLSRHGRTAIFDFDYHHGNGTQDIFYRSSEVLFVSIHADPETDYPHFYGYADEVGADDGRGFTRNYPLARSCAMTQYRATVAEALEQIARFDPEYLVVSVGYDAYEEDPVGGLCVPVGGFAEIGAQIAGLNRPTLLVQEGGYSMPDLGRCAVAFVSGVLG